MNAPLDVNPLASDFYLDGSPLDVFERLRNEAPCVRVQLNEPTQLDWVWLVTRYDDVRRVLRDEDLFTSTDGVTINRFAMSSAKSGGKPSLVTLAGHDHRRVRSKLRGTFTPTAVKLFSDAYRELARDIVAQAVAQEQVDFVNAVSVKLPLTAICDLLGIPDADREQVKRWGDALSAPMDPELAPTSESMAEAAMGFWAYCSALAEQRRQDPQQDIISALAPTIGTSELSHDEFLGLVTLLAVAGNDTTRNNISHSVEALIAHPHVWEALERADDKTWATTVEELTRWASPVLQFSRRATADVELGGQRISKGDAVVFSLISANYDERAFKDPRTFDMHRDPNPHLAFGSGAHFCVGAHLGRIETQVVLQELRSQVSQIEFDGAIEYALSTHVRAVKHLPVRLVPAT